VKLNLFVPEPKRCRNTRKANKLTIPNLGQTAFVAIYKGGFLCKVVFMTANLGYLPRNLIAGAAIWIADENPINDFDDITLDDFTPLNATLKYRFASATPIEVEATANDDDTGWTLLVEGSKTLLWSAGQVQFDALAFSDGVYYAVDAGYISVSASPLAVSQWVAIKTSATAAIANYAANPHSSFMVDGIQISYRSLKDLTDMIAYCDEQIAKDTGRRTPRRIRTRFTIQR